MDEKSFEAQYVEHFDYVVRVIVSKGLKREDAEELSQRAWLQAWRKRDLFSGRAAFKTWVCKIAMNMLFSDLRRVHLHQQALLATYSASYRADQESLVLAHQILSKLSDKQRNALIAATEITPKQESVETNRNLQTVRVNRFRARQAAIKIATA